jgi:hypothetical protein
MVRYASEPLPPADAWILASRGNTTTVIAQLGLAAVPLMALGVWVRVVRRNDSHGIWCSLFALAAALWVFHSFVYAVEGGRYLLAVFGVGALFAAAGLHWIARELPWPKGGESGHRIRVLACAVALVALATSSPSARQTRGFAEAAADVLGGPPLSQTTTLVSSDPVGEGAYVAAVATMERTPRSIVLRGSKLLASGTWMGINYASRYDNAQALLSALDRARVAHVVVDDGNREAHHRLLDLALRGSADWRLRRRFGVSSKQGGVRVYERVVPLRPGTPEFELDTSNALGYNLRSR